MKNFRISEFVVWTDSNTMLSSASHPLISEFAPSSANYRPSLFVCLRKLICYFLQELSNIQKLIVILFGR